MNTSISFILSSLAGFSTLLGGFVIFFSRRKTLNFLIAGISFAAGVMFFLSIFDLFPESFVFLNHTYNSFISLIIMCIFICVGVCLAIIIDKVFPSTFDNETLYKIGLITMIGIIIHNIPEGIATFVTAREDIKLGISMAIAITMHNIPEGISIALPIFYHTKSKKKAFLYTFICSLSEPFGALIAYLFFNPSFTFLGIIYALIGGIMVHISLYELMPNVLQYKRYRIIYSFYILGFILVLINCLLF